MRRKKVDVKKNSTKIAIGFFIFVIAIILTSLIFKAIAIVGKSKFDGRNRFTVSVSNSRNIKLISFSPTNRSISVLKLDGKTEKLNIGRYLGIPIDGFVKASFLESNEEVAPLMSGIFFGYKDIETNLTIVDIFRLYLLGRTTPLSNIASLNISTSLESVKVDKLVAKLFNDEEIEKENQTIEIINTTSVTGLGGRLARLITNMGGNVIQVSTKDNLQKESIILYDGKKSQTLDRLSKVLGFRTSEMSKRTIADITVVIGEDSKNATSF